jgi:hypothetical protein
VGPDDPTHYTLADHSLGTAFFDPQTETARSEIDEAVNAKGLHLGAELRTAFAAALQKDGYQVVVKSIPHPPQRLLDRYDNVVADADAILDASIETSDFYRDPFHKLFAPSLLIRVRLIDAMTKNVRFDQSYAYVDGDPPSSIVHLQPGHGYFLPLQRRS